MHTRRLTDVVLVALLASSTAALAAAPFSVQDTGVGAGGPAPVSGVTASVKGNSGRASSAYSFSLPPARGRYQPTLQLSYTSGAPTGYAGVGWSVSLSSISPRLNATLGPDGSTRNDFVLVLNGQTSLLVPDGTPSGYRPEIGESYARAVYDGSAQAWFVVDGVGNIFRFSGQQGSSCYLGLVTDVDGNTAQYQYQFDNGNTILQSISYNRYNPSSPTDTRSPDSFFVGQYGTVVTLQYIPSEITDVTMNPGGQLGARTQVLGAVLIQRPTSTSPVTVFSYGLTYSASAGTGRPLLAAISKIGTDAVSVDTTRFEYTQLPTLGWSPSAQTLPGPTTPAPTLQQCQDWFSHNNGRVFTSSGVQSDVSNGYNTVIQGCTVRDIAAWVDLDGDSVPDIIWGDGNGLYWARNRRTPRGPIQFDGATLIPSSAGGLWSDFRVQGQSPSGRVSALQTAGYNYVPDSAQTKALFDATGTAFVDMNGDGRPDLVGTSSPCGSNAFSVKLNNGYVNAALSFAAAICVAVPPGAMADWTSATGLSYLQAAYYTPSTASVAGVLIAGLVDMTGDGVADFVILTGPVNARKWHVYAGYQTAAGWAFASTFSPGYNAYAPGYSNDGVSSSTHFLADVNNDGFPDRVTKSGAFTFVEFNSPIRGFVQIAGNGTGWLPAFQRVFKYPNPAASYLELSLGDGTVDLDRDGRPDFLVGNSVNGNCPNDPVTSRFLLYASKGLDLTTTATILPALGPTRVPCPPSYNKYDAANAVVFHTDFDFAGSPPPTGFNANLVDVDADGSVDYVAADADLGSWVWYRSAGAEIAPPDLLARVVSGSGLTTSLDYLPSSYFGIASGFGVYPVVRHIVTSGAGIPTQTTRYWYASPAIGVAWNEPSRPESLGFSQSWEQDDATLLIRQINWGSSHATNGFPIAEIVGPSASGTFSSALSPPAVNPYLTVTHSPLFKSIITTYCGATPTGADYPVIRFDSNRTATQSDSGLSSSVTIDCADVDRFGNVSKFRVDQDSGGIGDEYYGYATFATESRCTSCPKEIRADTGPNSANLYQHIYHYDAPVGAFDNPSNTVTAGHVNYIEELVSPGGAFEVSDKRSYYGNGNLAAIRRNYPGPAITTVTSTTTYDPMQVQISRVVTTDGQTTIAEETSYDSLTGLPQYRMGPYVPGPDGQSPIPGTVPTEYYLFDAATRLIGISRGAPSGTVITKPLAVFFYGQPGIDPLLHTPYPRSVTTFTFAGDRSVDAKNVPATDDIAATVDYFDGRGRFIQRRRRLATGSPSQATSPTNLVGTLGASQWLVESAIIQDGAGRLVARFDPYYQSREGLWIDPARSTGTTRTLVSTSYDGMGRPACQTRHSISGDFAPPVGCLSSLPDATDYALATRLGYSAASVTPGGRSYLAIDLIPNARSGLGVVNKMRHFVDAVGRVAAIQDPYGNTSQVSRDTLGRNTSLTRTSGTTQVIAYQRAYDLRGRITDETDLSSGSKHFTYLPTGELASIVQQPVGAYTAPSSGVEFSYGSLGRIEKRAGFRLILTTNAGTCGVWQKQFDAGDSTTYTYDTPYTSSFQYKNLVGKLASVQSATGVTAYSYTEDGAIEREDRWIAGLAGVTQVGTAYRNDGLPLSASVGVEATATAISYSYSYDSAKRLVKVDDADGTRFWDLTGQLTGTGAHDAYGVPQTVLLDAGRVSMSQSYSPTSRLLASYQVALQPSGTATPLYSVDTFAFQSGKLGHFRERVADTNYNFDYDRAGRLSSADATPFSSLPTAQRYAEKYGFFTDNSLTFTASSAPSFNNVQFVQRTSPSAATQSFTYASGRPDVLMSVVGTGTGVASSYLSYDGRGRGLIVSESTSPNTTPALRRYTYDAFGRLRSISRFGSKVEDLSYGPDGKLARRVFTAGPDQARNYASDDVTVVQRQNLAIVYAHVKVAGQRIASVWRSMALPSQAVLQSGVIYYHRDRLGSVVNTSVLGGLKGLGYRYSPYGSLDRLEGTPSDAVSSELGYTGALQLSEGLVLLGERVYSPDLRRFLQADDVSDHRYTYADGDPANVIDPTGEDGEDAGGVLSLFAAAQEAFRINFVVGNWDSPPGAPPGETRISVPNVIHDRAATFAETDVAKRVHAVQKELEPLGAFIDKHPYAIAGTGITIATLGVSGWAAVGICAATGIISELDDIDFKDINFQNHGALLAAGVLTHGVSSKLQLHHYLSNKNRTFTPTLAAIIGRYGLTLEHAFNKELLPHLGRHPIEYHLFVLEGTQRAAREAGNNVGKFLELFELYVKEPIRANPALLTKKGWGR